MDESAVDQSNTTISVALNISSILDEIIWLIHIGGCTFCDNLLFTSKDSYCKYEDNHMQDLFNCTIVSKYWAEHAIPHLWGYHLKFFGDLISIATDVSRQRSIYEEVHDGNKANPLLSAGFGRFIYYSKSVICLEIPDSPLSFLEIVLQIPGDYLLPRLRYLDAVGMWLNEDYAPSFLKCILSSSTQQVQLAFGRLPEAAHLDACINSIAFHSKNLTVLAIQSLTLQFDSVQGTSVHDGTVHLLSNLPLLQALIVSPNWVTTRIIGIVSKSVLQLRLLSAQQDSYHGEDLLRVLSNSISTTDSSSKSFPNLTSLLLLGAIVDINTILESLFQRKHRLEFLSIVFKNSEVVSTNNLAFTKAISLNFPYLCKMHLDFSRCNTGTLEGKNLRPLEVCSNLEDLKIRGVRFASNAELSDIIPFWSRLERLSLIDNGIDSLKAFRGNEIDQLRRAKMDGLELECLHIFDKCLPLLRMLEISMVASDIRNLKLSTSSFQGIENLVIRHSFLNFEHPGFKGHDAARYVSSFLRPGSKVFVYCDFHPLVNFDATWKGYLTALEDFSDRLCGAIREYIDIHD